MKTKPKLYQTIKNTCEKYEKYDNKVPTSSHYSSHALIKLKVLLLGNFTHSVNLPTSLFKLNEDLAKRLSASLKLDNFKNSRAARFTINEFGIDG